MLSTETYYIFCYIQTPSCLEVLVLQSTAYKLNVGSSVTCIQD